MNEPRSNSKLPSTGLNIEGGCLWGAIGAFLAILILVVLVPIASMNRLAAAGNDLGIEMTIIPHNTSTPTPAMDQSITETVTPEDSPEPGEVIYYSIGELVEIYGTEGDGLRLRNAPGLDSTINILALENEVFEVRGGPEEVDGYMWWFLINPYDNSIQGWSVGNFIRRLGT
jgi:hypothetical protein